MALRIGGVGNFRWQDEEAVDPRRYVGPVPGQLNIPGLPPVVPGVQGDLERVQRYFARQAAQAPETREAVLRELTRNLPPGSQVLAGDRSIVGDLDGQLSLNVRLAGDQAPAAAAPLGATESPFTRRGFEALLPGSRLAWKDGFARQSNGFDPQNAPDRGIESLLTGVNAAGEPVDSAVLVDPAMQRGPTPHPLAFVLNRGDFAAVKGQDPATANSWPIEWEAYKEYLGGLAQEPDLLNERLRDDPKFSADALAVDPSYLQGGRGGSADRTDYYRVPALVQDRSGGWREVQVDPKEVINTVTGNPDAAYSSERSRELTRAEVYKEILDETATPVMGESALRAAEAAGRFVRLPAEQQEGSLVGYLTPPGGGEPAPVYAPADLRLRREVPDPSNVLRGVVTQNEQGYRIGSSVNRDAARLAERIREEDPALAVTTNVPRKPVLGLGALRAGAERNGVRYFERVPVQENGRIVRYERGRAIDPSAFSAEGILTGAGFDPMKSIIAVRPDGTETRLLPRWNEQTGLGYIVEDSLTPVESGVAPLMQETLTRLKAEAKGGMSTSDFVREVAAGRYSVEAPQRDVMADLARTIDEQGIDPAILTNRLATAAGDPTMVAAARLRGALEDYKARTGRGVPTAVAVAWAQDLAKQSFSPKTGLVDPQRVLTAAAEMGRSGVTRPLFAPGSNAARILEEGMKTRSAAGQQPRTRTALQVSQEDVSDVLEALGQEGQARYGAFGLAPEDEDFIYGGGFGVKQLSSAELASEQDRALRIAAQGMLQPGAPKSEAQVAMMADLAARVAVQEGRPAEEVLAEIMAPPVRQIQVPSRETTVNTTPGLGGYAGEGIQPRNRTNLEATRSNLEGWRQGRINREMKISGTRNLKAAEELAGRRIQGTGTQPPRQAVRSAYQRSFDLGVNPETGRRQRIPYSSVAANLGAEVGSPEQEAAMALLADRMQFNRALDSARSEADLDRMAARWPAGSGGSVNPALADRTRNWLARRAQAKPSPEAPQTTVDAGLGQGMMNAAPAPATPEAQPTTSAGVVDPSMLNSAPAPQAETAAERMARERIQRLRGL